MSDLLNEIRNAQIRAGEDAVIASLRSRGLAPPAEPTPQERRIADLEQEVAALRLALNAFNAGDHP